MNKRRRLLLEKRNKPRNESIITHPVEEEIKSLIENNPIDAEKNPLKWYKNNEQNYPFATKLYLKYASIPVTSVPSEKVEKSVILSDFYRKKVSKDSFVLCQECKPAKYKILCKGHK